MEMTPPHGALYVVAKAPLPGACKTRLCPPLNVDEAADLAAAFLVDTLAQLRLEPSLVTRLVCRDRFEQAQLHALVNGIVDVSTQAGTGLGDALLHAFTEGLADGFPSVAVLGADSPTLPLRLVQHAFAALRAGADLVLGPSEDGGYYLLGASAVHRQLFEEMPWSTAAVAAETLKRAEALGLRSSVLPTWYDVDDAASLTRLQQDLRRLPRAVAPRTRYVLARSGGRGRSVLEPQEIVKSA